MRISSAFPSDYLKASDLNGRQVTVTMAKVTVEKIGKDSKPVLYFQGKQKGMVLNKTNANAIAANYGEDTDQWAGCTITLFETMVDFQGKSVPAIRVRVVPQQRQAPAPRQQAPVDNYQRDDSARQPAGPPPVSRPQQANYLPQDHQGDGYEGPDGGEDIPF